MAVLRKIALGLLLAASAGVLVMAVWELSNYRQWDSSRLNSSIFNNNDRARILQDRMELLTKRVGDMELLVLILLGTSGLYAIVFVGASYFSATSFARQADQTLRHVQDQIGLAMGDLRELQEETEQRLRRMTAGGAIPAAPAPPAPPLSPAVSESDIAEITSRLASHQGPLTEHARLELVRDENAAACLDVAMGPGPGSPLAGVFFEFGRIYAPADASRSRFYLERAQRLATPQSPLGSEIHYQLACLFAGGREFPDAMRELAAAFEHQFKTLEERLANDIEEGGKLYELASTAPFDKAVNDLLLNMSIGIG